MQWVFAPVCRKKRGEPYAGKWIFVDGKYKILDVIGRGGMSIVYLAINEKANRSWAVKELIRTDPRAAGISKKETDLLKKLHHPGIAGIVECDRAEGKSADRHGLRGGPFAGSGVRGTGSV